MYLFIYVIIGTILTFLMVTGHNDKFTIYSKY